MIKSRAQKAAANTATGAISEIVSLICGLILPRLILANFGSSYNGVTSSAKQLLSAISILTVGVAGATRISLYRSLADDDIKKTSGIFKATELYMRKVGFILLFYLAVLVVVYPLVVDTGYSWQEVAPLIIAAGISAAGRYFFGNPYNILIYADQRIYVVNICLTITNILNVIESVLLIHIGCSIQVVKLVSSLVLILNPVVKAIYVRRRYKLIKDVEPDLSALSMRREVMAHSIANIIHDHTDVLVLTIFCNVKIVSVYTVYNIVMSVLKRTEKVFSTGTEALFGNMWAKGETDKVSLYLGYYEFIIGCFISVVFSTALIMILPFISLYTAGVHDIEYILPSYAAVVIAAQMFYSFRTPYMTLVQGVGHYKQTRNGAIAEAVINLVSSVIMVQFVGIVGVAIGTLMANVFRTIQYAVYIDNHLVPRGKEQFIKRILWSIGNVLVIVAAANFLVASRTSPGWFSWVVTAVMVTLVSIVITAVSAFVFYRKDLFAVAKLVKRILRKKKIRKK